MIGPDREAVYVEIGSYVGHSASLILHHNYPTKVYCIDPCILPKRHYYGKNSQEQTIIDNLSKAGKSYHLLKGFSEDQRIIRKLHEEIDGIDILFIDGDHRYQAVINDFVNYEDKVRRGGFIIFDDYWDSNYSPDVRLAVNDIVKYIRQKKLPYQIIGTPLNTMRAPTYYVTGPQQGHLTEFILRKI